MLKLYTSTYDELCKRVELYMHDAGLEYERLNIGENPLYRKVVLKLGGRMQVPFLVDQERDISLYGPDEIIEYLTNQYGSDSK